MKRHPRRPELDPDADISGSVPLLLIGTFLWLLSLWILVSGFCVPVWRGLWSRTWTETTCEIIDARTEQRSRRVRGHDVTTTTLSVSYRYRMAGREFRSSRYDFTDGTFDGSGAEELVRLGPGAQVPCFVDPSDPAEATLTHRGFGSAIMAFLLEMMGAAGPVLFLQGKRQAEARGPSRLLDVTVRTGGLVTVLTLGLGIGLSVFTGAPVWAWLVFSGLPVGMLVFYRRLGLDRD